VNPVAVRAPGYLAPRSSMPRLTSWLVCVSPCAIRPTSSHSVSFPGARMRVLPALPRRRPRPCRWGSGTYGVRRSCLASSWFFSQSVSCQSGQTIRISGIGRSPSSGCGWLVSAPPGNFLIDPAQPAVAIIQDDAGDHQDHCTDLKPRSLEYGLKRTRVLVHCSDTIFRLGNCSCASDSVTSFIGRPCQTRT